MPDLDSAATGITCCVCRLQLPLGPHAVCPRCGCFGEELALNETLQINYSMDALRAGLEQQPLEQRRPGLWRHAEALPLGVGWRAESGVGNTPLVPLAAALGVERCWAKLEGANPTGSFKDRPVTVAANMALEAGARELAVFTSGNVGAALAAVCARAEVPCHVFLLPGAGLADRDLGVSSRKARQIAEYGADLLTTRGTLAELHTFAVRLFETRGWTFLHDYQAAQVDGDKTIAFEICEQLGWEVPDVVVVPTGTGTNVAGIHRGFEQYRDLGLIERVPRMIAVQPDGAASLVIAQLHDLPLVPTLSEVRPNVAAPITHRVASQGSLQALRASNGGAVAVSDGEMLSARVDLARRAGLLCETAAASALAGARCARAQGLIDVGESVVLILTSHGLKEDVGPDPVPTYVPSDSA